MFLITDVLVEAKIYLSTRSLSLISKDLTLLTSEALVCGKECGSGGRHYSLMRKYWQGVNYTLGSKLRIKTQTRLISITRVAAGSLWPFPSPRLPSIWLTLQIGNLLVVVKKEERGILICSAEDKYLGPAAI